MPRSLPQPRQCSESSLRDGRAHAQPLPIAARPRELRQLCVLARKTPIVTPEVHARGEHISAWRAHAQALREVCASPQERSIEEGRETPRTTGRANI
eukprot:14559072-Alexandrium_andersonii.AAC.1